ncbi:hypothetical protein D0Y53_05705 [Luteimonas weifangensis]|uniref:Uncharacterized protein n=1 Tax=Cognatiluteimonas weifangensis TaxID=2303539 RepID=A0A372DPD1_9GAMM|nr:hypothetical protein D0Y53_05705 [Luteimonas weifangensis]
MTATARLRAARTLPPLQIQESTMKAPRHRPGTVIAIAVFAVLLAGWVGKQFAAQPGDTEVQTASYMSVPF